MLLIPSFAPMVLFPPSIEPHLRLTFLVFTNLPKFLSKEDFKTFLVVILLVTPTVLLHFATQKVTFATFIVYF